MVLVPPGYRRSESPALLRFDGFAGVIDRIQEDDRMRGEAIVQA